MSKGPPGRPRDWWSFTGTVMMRCMGKDRTNQRGVPLTTVNRARSRMSAKVSRPVLRTGTGGDPRAESDLKGCLNQGAHP